MTTLKQDKKKQSRSKRIRYWISWVFLGPLIRAGWRWLRPRRVPVILQLSNIECGAASLAMILSYYGRLTTVSESRERFGVSRDGASAQTIARVARSYGLRVKAYSCNPADFKYLNLPAIVHWNFNHFIVVECWTPKYIEIIDPGSGRRRMTPEEFDEGFTGVVMSFEPTEQFERRRAQGMNQSIWYRQLKSIVGGPKMLGMFIQVLIVSLLLQAFGLIIPIFTKVVVDQVLPFRIDNVMPVLGLGLLLIVLMQVTIQTLRAALLIYLQARLDMQLMLGFFEHVLTLPFRFFQTRNSGDLLMRLSSNAVIRELLTNQTVSVLLDGFFVLIFLVILFIQDLSFGTIVIAIGLIQVALLIGSTRRAHELMEKDLLAQSHAQGYLVEALIGIETLKISGAEDRAFDHWSNLFSKQLNVSLQRNQLTALIGVVMSAFSMFSPLFLLWWGTMRVLDGAMSLGTMLALNALASAFFAPLASLVSSGQKFQMVGAHLERIADVVKAEPEQNIWKTREASPPTKRIELRDVSFRYDPNAPWVLRNVSFSIDVGKKVAVVGHTGSGKTTLGLLLLGLYEPSQGEILYDEIPLRTLNYRTLRNQFGVVLQQPFLFSGTIRQNIAFNDPNIAMDQIIEAARLAAVHEEIMQMPMRYETLVAEGGSALSGGQRQRIALARALVRTPPLLLLDEATSDLDAITEHQVEQNLSVLSSTRLVIAHRLSTIRDADLILVLDKGEIVERGTHAELLRLDQTYANLVRGQLETSVETFSDLTTAG